MSALRALGACGLVELAELGEWVEQAGEGGLTGFEVAAVDVGEVCFEAGSLVADHA